MTWLQTFSGRAFDIAAPRSEDVCIDDIAHALSNLCRFGGHCTQFYSVAEHSVHVSFLVPPHHALAALLHDATEAYVVDLPRPIKEMLPGYRRLEDGVRQAVAAHFDLDDRPPLCVKEADNAMLLAERDQILGPVPLPWTWADGLVPAARKVQCLAPEDAEVAFLSRFAELQA